MPGTTHNRKGHKKQLPSLRNSTINKQNQLLDLHPNLWATSPTSISSDLQLFHFRFIKVMHRSPRFRSISSDNCGMAWKYFFSFQKQKMNKELLFKPSYIFCQQRIHAALGVFVYYERFAVKKHPTGIKATDKGSLSWCKEEHLTNGFFFNFTKIMLLDNDHPFLWSSSKANNFPQLNLPSEETYRFQIMEIREGIETPFSKFHFLSNCDISTVHKGCNITDQSSKVYCRKQLWRS